jgi:hypothetical protein
VRGAWSWHLRFRSHAALICDLNETRVSWEAVNTQRIPRGVGFLLLLALANASTAVASEPSVCGYPMSHDLVERAEADVPVLMHPTAFAEHVSARGALRRRTHLIEERASKLRCPRGRAYLRVILKRLVHGSKLEVFARRAPSIRLIVQCSQQSTLPVAKAGPGNLLLAPGALLAQADSEDAIAAVLAHELAHLTLRHAERFAQVSVHGSGEDLLHLKSTQEREADITGLRILVSAGYDPGAAIDHLRAVDALAYARYRDAGLRTREGEPARRTLRARVHDDADTRARLLAQQIASCNYAPRLRTAVSGDVKQEASRLALRLAQRSVSFRPRE